VKNLVIFLDDSESFHLSLCACLGPMLVVVQPNVSRGISTHSAQMPSPNNRYPVHMSGSRSRERKIPSMGFLPLLCVRSIDAMSCCDSFGTSHSVEACCN